MINNYKCDNCDHSTVCKIVDKLAPFHEDAKKDFGVTLTINSCREYSSVDSEDEDIEDSDEE